MRRRVEIQDGPQRGEGVSLHASPVISTRKIPPPCIPTGDIRHIGHIRDGRISFEAFSKANLAKIPLDPDIERERKSGKKEEVVENAAERIVEGRAEREKKQARQKPKGKAKPKASKKPVTKKKYVKRRVKKDA